MQTVTAKAFREILNAEKHNKSVAFINVCTPSEYKEKHISGVESMPLDELEYRWKELEGKQTVYVHCGSGKRSQKAIEKLESLGLKAKLVNVEGGIQAWEGLSYPTQTTGKKIPIIRQVFILAGSLVFVSSILTLTVNIYFVVVPMFIAAGLTFAGITGWCGMALLLSKMPWNK